MKVQEIKDDVFQQPTVTTVKKDRSVQIALDARELNRNVIEQKDVAALQFPNHRRQGSWHIQICNRVLRTYNHAH